MHEETVSIWIRDLKQGDERAAEEIWERYFMRLVGVGKRILRNSNRQAADEEDVAISAFKSFCIRAREDRFPRLSDRDDLWKLLVTIVARKSYRVARKAKRTTSSSEEDYFEQTVRDGEPTADMVMQMDDTMDELFSRLADENLKQIALGKLDGKTNQELADQLGRSISFVERKLQSIRRVWSDVDPTANQDK